MATILDSMTEVEKTAYRRLKLKEMQDFNQDFIDDIGISRGDFNMKYAFTKNGEIVVGIFENEFTRPKGFYFEIIDGNLNPSDRDRTIYRVPNNQYFKEEFELDERGKYLVPLSQLKKINRQSAVLLKDSLIRSEDNYGNRPTQSFQKQTPKPFLPFENEPKPVEDAPYSDMTIRDYIAIHTGKPVSLKKWINDLVKN
jgi:uncharacterized protein YjiS (DUF1127 family)